MPRAVKEPGIGRGKSAASHAALKAQRESAKQVEVVPDDGLPMSYESMRHVLRNGGNLDTTPLQRSMRRWLTKAPVAFMAKYMELENRERDRPVAAVDPGTELVEKLIERTLAELTAGRSPVESA